jgi:hypothetical protein
VRGALTDLDQTLTGLRWVLAKWSSTVTNLD